jgi:hypothetical protein
MILRSNNALTGILLVLLNFAATLRWSCAQFVPICPIGFVWGGCKFFYQIYKPQIFKFLNFRLRSRSLFLLSVVLATISLHPRIVLSVNNVYSNNLNSQQFIKFDFNSQISLFYKVVINVPWSQGLAQSSIHGILVSAAVKDKLLESARG